MAEKRTETSGTVSKIRFNKVSIPLALLSSSVNADQATSDIITI